VPVLTSAGNTQGADTRLDLDSTLHRWGAPIIQGSRWVGCRLNDAGMWCIAPVRKQPAAPPPDGVERRSRERITLELAGLCLGLVDQPPLPNRPRLAEPDALVELGAPAQRDRPRGRQSPYGRAREPRSLARPDPDDAIAGAPLPGGAASGAGGRGRGHGASDPVPCARYRTAPGAGWPARSGSTRPRSSGRASRWSGRSPVNAASRSRRSST